VAGLIQAADGKFYGSTVADGAHGGGTIFKISREAKLTTLYNFCAHEDCADGYQPTGTLAQRAGGPFYGVTNFGGAGDCSFTDYGCGTAFRMTSKGKLTTLRKFCQGDCPDGEEPYAGLLPANDSNLYGTTESTVFRVTPEGKVGKILVFSCQPSCEDGWAPMGKLVEGTDSALYGTTSGGGANGDGTIFRIGARASLTTLHNFDGTDGGYAVGLVQATSGIFYGTTFQGGSSNVCYPGCGTVFSLNMGLGPFVTFVHDSGKAGKTAGILGQGFTGTSSVSFRGIPANFKVLSDTLIRATIPADASGYVIVTTPSGTLTSNVEFHVINY
jgi:uncharacterized repeat protein (TIGR03803 family)